MITRKMNERITFFEKIPMKNADGDVVLSDKVHFSCWAEVPKATTKEFRDRTSESIEAIQKRRIRKVFYIRFRTDVDTEMLIEWRGTTYQVIDLEEDWQSKDMLMVTCEVIE